jgi:tungstate transport system permease protein
MQYILEGLNKALNLVFYFDRETLAIALFSLKISAIAIFFATLVGIAIGFLIEENNFFGKKAVITIFNTLIGVPTVLVGLLVYGFTSNQGPLGPLGLLFTPKAMIIGQFILATPVIVALTIAALKDLDPRVKLTAMTLGASSLKSAFAVFCEARFSLMAAIVAGFGRVISEVGCAIMVGGNIKGYTRTMTTAIALETTKGEFELALALGIILLMVAFSINIFFHWLQAKEG